MGLTTVLDSPVQGIHVEGCLELPSYLSLPIPTQVGTATPRMVLDTSDQSLVDTGDHTGWTRVPLEDRRSTYYLEKDGLFAQ